MTFGLFNLHDSAIRKKSVNRGRSKSTARVIDFNFFFLPFSIFQKCPYQMTNYYVTGRIIFRSKYLKRWSVFFQLKSTSKNSNPSFYYGVLTDNIEKKSYAFLNDSEFIAEQPRFKRSTLYQGRLNHKF